MSDCASEERREGGSRRWAYGNQDLPGPDRFQASFGLGISAAKLSPLPLNNRVEDHASRQLIIELVLKDQKDSVE